MQKKILTVLLYPYAIPRFHEEPQDSLIKRLGEPLHEQPKQ